MGWTTTKPCHDIIIMKVIVTIINYYHDLIFANSNSIASTKFVDVGFSDVKFEQ